MWRFPSAPLSRADGNRSQPPSPEEGREVANSPSPPKKRHGRILAPLASSFRRVLGSTAWQRRYFEAAGIDRVHRGELARVHSALASVQHGDYSQLSSYTPPPPHEEEARGKPSRLRCSPFPCPSRQTGKARWLVEAEEPLRRGGFRRRFPATRVVRPLSVECVDFWGGG